LRSRPFLLTGALRWGNLQRRHRFALPLSLTALLAAAGLLTRPVAGHALEMVAENPLAPFISLASLCAFLTARRKGHLQRSLVDSWLAPLAAPPSLLARAFLAPLLQLLLLGAGIAIAFATGSLSPTAAITLWALVGGAYVAGSAVGWSSRLAKSAAAPDFHYVSVRKARSSWSQAPRLEPLSFWAVGQARVYAKPKVAATAMLLVLLGIPMGTRGETAMAIAAGVWVLLYVGALLLAVVRTAFLAARWLAPTTLGYFRLARAVGYRVVLVQIWIWAWIVFLTYAAGFLQVMQVESRLAVLSLLLSCVAIAVAVRVAMRSAGMRSS
jgi:hypothetical protein